MLTHADVDVDSNCFAPDPDADHNLSRCKNDATTWVDLPSGIRRYICPEHAAEVDRFFDHGTDDDHPKAGVCDRCRRLAPVDYIDETDGICAECKA